MHRSTALSAMSPLTLSRTSGTHHFQRSTGSGESHDRATVAAKRTLSFFGTTWGTEMTLWQRDS